MMSGFGPLFSCRIRVSFFQIKSLLKVGLGHHRQQSSLLYIHTSPQSQKMDGVRM